MAMSVGSSGGGSNPEVMAAINTTPLVDVMLVLLIIFLITIPVINKNVKVIFTIQRGGVVKVGFLTEPDHGIRGYR